MIRISPTYNERSWAIDLIGHLKVLATQNNRSIKDAGGEQTIRSEGGSLFPDVLLFGDRLFVARVNPPAFADQRLVPFEPLEGIDVELCHALLNSTICMFIIEGMGFGRGLGALDLNKDRIETYMHLLNPNQLNQAGIDSIKAAFIPLLQRDVMEVADEVEQADRQAFDDAVISAYNLNLDKQHIYDCLLSLVGIRMTANS